MVVLVCAASSLQTMRARASLSLLLALLWSSMLLLTLLPSARLMSFSDPEFAALPTYALVAGSKGAGEDEAFENVTAYKVGHGPFTPLRAHALSRPCRDVCGHYAVLDPRLQGPDCRQGDRTGACAYLQSLEIKAHCIYSPFVHSLCRTNRVSRCSTRTKSCTESKASRFCAHCQARACLRCRARSLASGTKVRVSGPVHRSSWFCLTSKVRTGVGRDSGTGKGMLFEIEQTLVDPQGQAYARMVITPCDCAR